MNLKTEYPLTVIFLITVGALNTAAAPTGTVRVTQPSGSEFWTNPCGSPPTSDGTLFPDNKYAEQYASQIGLALLYVNNWVEDFSEHAHRTSFAAWIEIDAAVRYDWLKGSSIPKTTGQHLGSSHYSTAKFNEMLTFSSEMFQRISVGLEQIDVEKLDVDFKNNFADTIIRIKQVLCVLQTIFVDKGMTPAPNPTRSIMPSELRNLQVESDRDLRTFRVLKEYINALEYFQDGFNYLKTL